jgi:thiol-disulfide isomerase/thioredoxin
VSLDASGQTDDIDDQENAAEATVEAGPDGIVLGEVTLEPLDSEQQASLSGRVALDDDAQVASTEVRLSLAMAAPNTPHHGFSPRRSWPEPQTVAVGEDGTFEVTGLTPGDYNLMMTADEHSSLRKKISLEPGEPYDAGDLALRSTNLGFYIGADEPDVPELAWEEDFDTALERAKRENRPLMVMMTATWCGPCKALERDSLSNVWIRHFLAPFVVVQAYEEQKVEEKYGLRGYPTLVFCDSAGEPAHKTVGYRPAIEFAAEVARGLQAVETELPVELQTLIDKGVVVVD